MADALSSSICCAPDYVNNPALNELRDCTKCIELEIKLQKLNEELSSIQLIVELINKERVHNKTIITSTQECAMDREEDEIWEVKNYKSTKKRTEGNSNQRNQKSLIIETPVVATANRYTILETDSHMSQYDDKIVNPHKKTLTAVSNDQKKGMKHIARNHPTTSTILQENQDPENVTELNLQNYGSAYQSVDGDHKKTYNIPVIISERQSIGNTGRTMQQGISHQGATHSNSINVTTQSECKKHKILIIGDSHVTGLSEKIIDRLDDSYSILGIAKPNANIAAIISQTYLQVEDFTKEDIIIFLGGTNDISRNEAKKGLRVLEDFIQQTVNTNLILLDAPHRYDLSSKSCVNTEVKLYNRRLQSFAHTSTHVTILSVPTERSHHTRHGLHYNKKGKTWIVDAIEQRIKNWNSSGKITAPIKLPWKEDMTYPESHVSSLTTSTTEECLSPNIKKDGNPDCWDNAVDISCQSQAEFCPSPNLKNGDNPDDWNNIEDVGCQTQIGLKCLGQIQSPENDQDDEITLRKSTRLRRHPSSKHQDFLY